MSALSSVVLPLAVPPLRRILRQVCNTRSASSRMCAGSAPCETSCATEKDGVPKRRTQMAKRDPSPNRASRMGHVQLHATLTLPTTRNAWMSRSSIAPPVSPQPP